MDILLKRVEDASNDTAVANNEEFLALQQKVDVCEDQISSLEMENKRQEQKILRGEDLVGSLKAQLVEKTTEAETSKADADRSMKNLERRGTAMKALKGKLLPVYSTMLAQSCQP